MLGFWKFFSALNELFLLSLVALFQSIFTSNTRTPVTLVVAAARRLANPNNKPRKPEEPSNLCPLSPTELSTRRRKKMSSYLSARNPTIIL